VGPALRTLHCHNYNEHFGGSSTKGKTEQLTDRLNYFSLLSSTCDSGYPYLLHGFRYKQSENLLDNQTLLEFSPYNIQCVDGRVEEDDGHKLSH
jgi:hypothetical protein